MKKNEKKYPGVYEDKKNGTYYVTTKAKCLDGIYVSVIKRGFKTAPKAYAWKNEERVRLQNTYSTTINNNKTEFEKLFESFIERRKNNGLAVTSLRADKYKCDLYILPFFKDKTIGKITNFDIQTYKEYLGKQSQLNGESKNKVLSLILSFFDYLVLFNYIKSERYNDYKRILERFSTRDVKPSGCRGVYGPEEFEVFISTFTQENEYKYKLLFEFIFQTGCRNCESRSVWVEDFNFITNEVRVHSGVSNKTGSGKVERLEYLKTNSEKLIKLPTKLANRIQEWIIKNDLKAKDYVFFGAAGPSEPASANATQKCAAKHFKMIDLPPIRIHDLRHSHVCNLLEADVDPKMVAERVGHNDVNTTINIYNHVTKKKSEKLNNVIETIFS